MNNSDLISKALKQELEHLWQEALQSYIALYDINHETEFLEKMAWCASRALKYDESISYYLQLVDIQPNNAKWYYGVGYQYYMQKNWSSANEWFEKALKIYPDYLIVKYRYGYSLRQLCGNKLVLKKAEYWNALKQFDECGILWNKFNEESKHQNANIYSDICYQKGKLLVERNQIDNAIACFETAISLQNGIFEDCQYQLSKAYLTIGNLDMAEKYLPTANNKYYITELNIDIYLARNQLDEAQALLINLLKYRKKDYLFRKLSELLLIKNELDIAIKYICRAEEMNNRNHLNTFTKAKILFKAGFINAAYASVNKSIELKNNYYSTEFIEAEEFKKIIELEINEKNYSTDDEEKLQQFIGILNNNQQNGKVTQYIEQKGYGFILFDNKKYFFHITAFPKNEQSKIYVGCQVKFEIVSNAKGLTAQNIKMIR